MGRGGSWAIGTCAKTKKKNLHENCKANWMKNDELLKTWRQLRIEAI